MLVLRIKFHLKISTLFSLFYDKLLLANCLIKSTKNVQIKYKYPDYKSLLYCFALPILGEMRTK